MEQKITDYYENAYMLFGMMVIFIPALLVMLHGIKNGRAVKTAVCALIIAFIIWALIVERESIGQGIEAIFSNALYMVLFVLSWIAAAIIAYIILRE